MIFRLVLNLPKNLIRIQILFNLTRLEIEWSARLKTHVFSCPVNVSGEEGDADDGGEGKHPAQALHGGLEQVVAERCGREVVERNHQNHLKRNSCN